LTSNWQRFEQTEGFFTFYRSKPQARSAWKEEVNIKLATAMAHATGTWMRVVWFPEVNLQNWMISLLDTLVLQLFSM